MNEKKKIINSLLKDYFLVIKTKSFFKLLTISFILSLIVFFAKKPIYTAKVTFYTNYNEINANIGYLASIASSFSNDNSELSFSIEDYLSSDHVISDIISKKYNIGEEYVTLIDHWGGEYDNYFSLNLFSTILKLNRNLMFNPALSEIDRKSYYAKREFIKNIEYSQDRISGLVVIQFSTKSDPSLSKQIIENIYESVISYSTSITNLKAEEKKKFIEERLITINSELIQKENELVNFLEKNNDIDSSPYLIVEKGRIDREIFLYNQLFNTLSDQLELSKIESKKNTSSIFLLDAPENLELQDGLNILKYFIFFTLTISCLVILNIYRKY